MLPDLSWAESRSWFRTEIVDGCVCFQDSQKTVDPAAEIRDRSCGPVAGGDAAGSFGRWRSDCCVFVVALGLSLRLGLQEEDYDDIYRPI